MRIMVTLNGTDKNPYERWGLTQNPMPAIAKYGFSGANRILADLDANPIKDQDDLRRRLKGCTTEFINVCCHKFKKGERVKFIVEWEGE